MKKSELRQIIREELKKLQENIPFALFSELESAIRHHDKGNSYYDTTRLINIYNRLTASDQIKAKQKYSNYFGLPITQKRK